jgi:hypothetical protein
VTAIDILPVLVANLLFGGLFVLGGTSKLGGFAVFTETLGNYRLLPAGLVRPAGAMIAFAELALGAAAIIAVPLGSQIAMLGIAALLFAYAAAMGINIARGRDHIDCGCSFGAARASLGWELVARNIALGLIAFAMFALPVSARPLGAIDWISGVGAIAAFALLYLGFGQLSAVRLRGKAVVR